MIPVFKRFRVRGPRESARMSLPYYTFATTRWHSFLVESFSKYTSPIPPPKYYLGGSPLDSQPRVRLLGRQAIVMIVSSPRTR